MMYKVSIGEISMNASSAREAASILDELYGWSFESALAIIRNLKLDERATLAVGNCYAYVERA